MELLVVLLGTLIAGGSLWVAIISLRRSKAVQDQQVRLQQKQEELTDIQLKLHKQQVDLSTSEMRTEKVADIRVTLEGTAKQAHFMIRNWGDGEAQNANLKVEPVAGESSPFVQGDYDVKLPIPRLAPGSECSVLAALTFDTGVVFDATWTWDDEDGSARKETSRISL